jgi:hypothetical protein
MKVSPVNLVFFVTALYMYIPTFKFYTRNTLHNINIEPKTRLSFIEYLLFKYNKSAAELFENKPNSELVAKLEAAVGTTFLLFCR